MYKHFKNMKTTTKTNSLDARGQALDVPFSSFEAIGTGLSNKITMTGLLCMATENMFS